MNIRGFAVSMMVGVLLIWPLLTLAQDRVAGGPQSVTLIVNGRSGTANLVKVNGKSYIELEKLVSIGDGSIASDATRIILILPGSGNTTNPVGQTKTAEPLASSVGAPEPSPNHLTNPGFSKEFLRAAIEEMAAIRAWRAALTNAVQGSYPVNDVWISSYRAEAAQDLRMASVAVTTDSDRQAIELLTNEFNFMKKLSDKFAEASKNMNYVSPDAVEKDPLDQKILSCAHSLAAMASSGHFVDDGACR